MPTPTLELIPRVIQADEGFLRAAPADWWGLHIDERDALGRSGLMWAYWLGLSAVSHLLISHGADQDAEDYAGRRVPDYLKAYGEYARVLDDMRALDALMLALDLEGCRPARKAGGVPRGVSI